MRRLFPLLLLAGCVVDQTSSPIDPIDEPAPVEPPPATDPIGPGEPEGPSICGVAIEPYSQIQAERWGIVDPAECVEGGCRVGVCGALGRCVEPLSEDFQEFTVRRAQGVLFARGVITKDADMPFSVALRAGEAELELRVQFTALPSSVIDTFVHLDTAADSVFVRTVDNEGQRGAEVAVPIVDMPRRAVGEGCDSAGFADHCGAGAACLRVDGDFECVGVEVDAWLGERGVKLDFETSKRVDGWNINALNVGPRLVSPRRVDDTRWFATGAVLAEGNAVRHQGHVIAAVSGRQPVAIDVGDACDRERVADQCAAGSACKSGVCKVISAPQIADATIYQVDGGDAVVVAGSDADNDVVAMRIDGGEPFVIELGDSVNQPGARANAVVVPSDDGFYIYWSSESGLPSARGHGVTLLDAEGLESERAVLRTARVSHGTPAAANSACDLAGMLFTCPEGAVCDRTDCNPRVICRAPQPSCEFHESEPLVGAVEGTMSGAPDSTTSLSCRVNSGMERFYEFTAPSAGRYRARLDSETGDYLYLAVRRSCDQPGIETSEAFCGPIDEGVAQGEFDLAAGERVTLVVAAHWTRSAYQDPYRLTVEPR